jgi:hypothetical protein
VRTHPVTKLLQQHYYKSDLLELVRYTCVAGNFKSLNFVALNFMQYTVIYSLPFNAFMVEQLLLQICYTVV